MCGFAVDGSERNSITARAGSKGWRGEPTECTRCAGGLVKDETRARFPWAARIRLYGKPPLALRKPAHGHPEREKRAEPTMTENAAECAVAEGETGRVNSATRCFSRSRRAKGADRARGLHIRPRFRSFLIQHGAGRSSGRTRSLCTEASLLGETSRLTRRPPSTQLQAGRPESLRIAARVNDGLTAHGQNTLKTARAPFRGSRYIPCASFVPSPRTTGQRERARIVLGGA